MVVLLGFNFSMLKKFHLHSVVDMVKLLIILKSISSKFQI